MYVKRSHVTSPFQSDSITGYETTTSPISNGVITITNTHKPETTSVTVNKDLVDDDNKDGIRPAKITVTLQSNGSTYGSPVDISSPWSYTWSNLPVYDKGTKGNYTVKEDSITG